MSRPKKLKQIFVHRQERKHEHGITVTVKLAYDKK